MVYSYCNPDIPSPLHDNFCVTKLVVAKYTLNSWIWEMEDDGVRIESGWMITSDEWINLGEGEEGAVRQ